MMMMHNDDDGDDSGDSTHVKLDLVCFSFYSSKYSEFLIPLRRLSPVLALPLRLRRWSSVSMMTKEMVCLRKRIADLLPKKTSKIDMIERTINPLPHPLRSMIVDLDFDLTFFSALNLDCYSNLAAQRFDVVVVFAIQCNDSQVHTSSRVRVQSCRSTIDHDYKNGSQTVQGCLRWLDQSFDRHDHQNQCPDTVLPGNLADNAKLAIDVVVFVDVHAVVALPVAQR